MTDRATAARTVWVLTLCTSMALIGDGTIYAVLPALFSSVGVTAVQVGTLLSINRLVRPPLNMLSGWLTLRVAPRWIYLTGLFLGALSTLGYGLVHGFWPLLLLRALWGTAWALLAVAAYAIILDTTAPAFRGRYSGMYFTFSYFGGALGAMAGGFMADALGFSRAMVSLGLFSTASLGILLLLPRRGLEQSPASYAPPKAQPPLKRRLRLTWREWNAPLLLIVGLNFCERLFFAGILYGTMGYYIGQITPHGIAIGPRIIGPASLTAVLLFTRNLIAILSGPLFGHLSDRLCDRAQVLILGETLGAIGLFCFAMRHSLLWLGIGAFLTAVAYGVVSPMLISWMGDLTRQGKRGGIIGLYQTMGDLGSGLGPLFAYPFIVRWGPPLLYALSAGLMLFTIPFILWVRHWSEPRKR